MQKNIKITGALCSEFFSLFATVAIVLSVETEKDNNGSQYDLIKKLKIIYATLPPNNSHEKICLKEKKKLINDYLNKNKNEIQIYPWDDVKKNLIEAIKEKIKKTKEMEKINMKPYKIAEKNLKEGSEYIELLEKFMQQVVNVTNENEKIIIKINKINVALKKIDFNTVSNVTTKKNAIIFSKYVDFECNISLKTFDEKNVTYQLFYYIVLAIKRFTHVIDQIYEENIFDPNIEKESSLQKFFKKHMFKQIKRENFTEKYKEDFNSIDFEEKILDNLEEQLYHEDQTTVSLLKQWNEGSALNSLAIKLYKENQGKIKKSQEKRSTLSSTDRMKIKDFYIIST